MSAGLQVVFAGAIVVFAGPHCEGVGPHCVGVGPLCVGVGPHGTGVSLIVVVGGSGDALVVFTGPLSPWEPRAVEDADVNLTTALHKESSNKKSGLS